jgi:AcrR family transcriptional regulator
MGAYEQAKASLKVLVRTGSSFESIKISDICEGAGISRTAFYNYFKSKYDTLSHIIYDDLIVPAITLRKLSPDDDMRLMKRLMAQRLYLNIGKDAAFYRRLILDRSDIFVESFIAEYYKLNLELLSGRPLDEFERDYYSYMMASSQAMLIVKYVKDGMTAPIEELIKVRDHFVMAGLYAAMQGRMANLPS